MSHPRRSRLWWCVFALCVLVAPFAVRAQEMKPATNIVLPYFEIRLPDPNAASLIDTQFGVVNASSTDTEVEFTIYTNWGIPVLQFNDTLLRTEPRGIDLEAWLIEGAIPGRILTEAELAELHAALTGQPSPTDHLYRGTAIEPSLMVGYLIVRALGKKDVLWGDTWSIDPMTDYFQGETLALVDDNLQAQCSRHAIRFVNRDDLFEGTEFIVWTGRRFEPSPTPEPGGAKVQMSASLYDEQGNHVCDRTREFLATQTFEACHLENLPPIGWIDMVFDQTTHVAEHLHSLTAASAELHSWCVPTDIAFEGGPGIDLEKYVNQLDADKAPGAAVRIGDEVKFEYIVKNTGDVPLLNIEVSDSDGLAVTCPKTSLEAGERMTCTATAVALPCSHKNIGMAVGWTASGQQVKDRDPGWYTAAYDSSIALEKRVNGSDADQEPGLELAKDDPVNYTFEVTNTGASALTKIKVKDDEGLEVSCPANALDPGASMTCTAPAMTAANGSHANVATVTAEDPCEVRVTATDAAHYFVVPKEPAIDLEKYVNGEDADVPTGPIVATGRTVQFRYVITNTGNVPLTDVTMEDVAFLTCASATLAVGASFECGTSTTAVEGQHMNTATAHGHWQTQTVEDTDLGHYFAKTNQPGIDVEKYVNELDADTPTGPLVNVGSDVTFTFVVKNTGDVLLTNLVLTDDRLSLAGCTVPATLAPGATFECSVVAKATAGQHVNVGRITAEVAGDTAAQPGIAAMQQGAQVEDTDPAHYFGRAPLVDLEKLVNDQDADTPDQAVHVVVGSTVQYKYVVTNLGNLLLTSLAVTDNTGIAVTCPKSSLEPGESMTCVASRTAVAGLNANIGTVNGQAGAGSSGEAVSDSDPAHYYGERPSINIEKLVNGQDADTAAQAVHVPVASALLFTYVVTNTGDVALTSIAVTDDQGLTVTCPKDGLTTGESMTCTAPSTAAAGLHTNVGTVTGTPPAGPNVTASDPANYIGDPPLEASIDIEKLVNGQDADTEALAVRVSVGSALQFTYVTTNTGQVKLTSVLVTDDTISPVTCPKTVLEVGESMTCTASTSALTGTHTNIGTATGTPPTGSNVSDSDPAVYQGASLQGCTPGYWKNHTGSWPPTGYSPSQAVDSVFASVNTHFPSLGNATLLQALAFGGGSGTSGAAEILLRAATAALLNAAHPNVLYTHTSADVISMTNTALSSNIRDTMLALAAQLDAENNRGCPLN